MNNARLRAVSRLALWSGGSILAATLVLGIIPNFLYAQSPAWDTLLVGWSVSPSPPAVVVVPTSTSTALPLPPTLTVIPPTLLPTALAASVAASATPLADAPPRAATAMVMTTPSPKPTAIPSGSIPVSLYVPSIKLDVPITPVDTTEVDVNGETYAMLDVPDYRAAGWQRTSAHLGVTGNVVVNGHNTLHGEVFRNLQKLKPGNSIQVEGADGTRYDYTVAEKLILPELGQPIEVRLRNAQYIAPTTDTRLTLVTCHPYGSLRNRLLILAYPAPPELAR